MSVQTRIEPIDRDLAVIFADDLSPEARSAVLAAFATEGLEDAQAVNAQALGRVPTHDTYVDGQAGAAVESVRPDGVVVFEFELIGDTILWIAEQLARHSPFRTGRYAAAHLLFADGVPIEASAVLPEASEYVFVNATPYARKIETGLSPQAPDGVYQAVAVLAQRRFGNIAKVRFGYRGIVGGGEAGTRRRDASSRQPAIVISL